MNDIIENLYVCATPLHVLCALSKEIKNEKKSGIYITNNVRELDALFEKLIVKLKESQVFSIVLYRKRRSLEEKLLIEDVKDIFEKKQLKRLIGNKTKSIIFTWNTESLYKKANNVYRMSPRIDLIEDGSMVYKRPKDSTIKRFIKKYLYGIIYGLENQRKIERVYVSFPSYFVGTFGEKIKKYSLINDLKVLDTKSISRIINVFLTDDERKKIAKISQTNKENILILTQPLYKFNGIAKKEQILMYRKIIQKYISKYNIILKKHPSDGLDYDFDDVVLIDGKFPSELLNFMDLKFTKAIGICTSAVDSVNATERINTEPNFFEGKK